MGWTDGVYGSETGKEGGRYMKYFDVYALCSHTEGYPLAFIEAAAAKLPVVCSDIPVFPRASFRKSVLHFFRLGNIDSLCDALVCADKRADVLSEKVYAYYLHLSGTWKNGETIWLLYNRC